MDPRLKALEDERNALLAKAKPLVEKSKTGELTEAEGTDFDTLMASIDGIPARRKAIEQDIEKNAKRAAAFAEAERAATTLQPARSTQNVNATAHIEVREPEFTKDPKKGFATPTEFMSLVIEAGRGQLNSMDFDPRLKYLSADRFKMAAGSDEGRGNSDPAGGFLVPEAFSPNLLQVNPEDDFLGARTTKIPMSSPNLKFPARTDKDHTTSVSGGLTVTRKPETISAAASQMTFEQVNLVAHGLYGLSYATEEILTDSPISFAAIIAKGFSEQFTAALIRERIRGLDVGEFGGVLNAGCTVSVNALTGQLTKTIVKENIDAMQSRCWGYGKAIWLANYDTLPQLKSLVQVVGVGGMPVAYLSTDANGAMSLAGRPIIFTEYCSTLGTAGDLILGNWGEYLEGLYQPMQSAESIHVRFVNHERAFKFWTRNAGLPWWRVALTPQNSTNTLSPFVTLATR